MLVEIHMLNNHAPSNLNRDDTNSPKDAIFGGYRRARISSQCLKRSIRKSEIFTNEIGKDNIAIRTRELPQLVYNELINKYNMDKSEAESKTRFLYNIGLTKEVKRKEDEDKLRTKNLLFIDKMGVNNLINKFCKLIINREEYESFMNNYEKQHKKNQSKDRFAVLNLFVSEHIKNYNNSVDLALFGRMTTTPNINNIEASIQVAHAISTSKIETEFDYFTAVDDLIDNKTIDKEGSAHIGDVEFNSATYYKYFSIHLEGLVENLGGNKALALQSIKAFIKAAALANPSGKQNSFAAHNPPDFIRIDIKKNNIPISYANAFIKPIQSNYQTDIMTKSINKLQNYANKINTVYSLNTDSFGLCTNDDIELSGLELINNMDDLRDKVINNLE